MHFSNEKRLIQSLDDGFRTHPAAFFADAFASADGSAGAAFRNPVSGAEIRITSL